MRYTAMIGALGLMALSTIATPVCSDDGKVAKAFDAAYTEWCDLIRQFAWSDNEHYTMNEPFRTIVALGPPAVPYIVAKLNAPDGHFLIFALSSITAKRFSPAELAGRQSNQAVAALWLDWWRGGTGGVKTAFGQAVAKWRANKAGNPRLWTEEVSYDTATGTLMLKETPVSPAGEAYLATQYQGIAVLPYLAEQFRAGNDDFADIALTIAGHQPTLPQDTPPTAAIKAKAFLSWWEQNKQDWLIPWPKEPTPQQAPAAEAGG